MATPETIRPYRDDDLDALLALRARCFDGLDVERERERRRWAFDDNPARRDEVPTAWIAEVGGEIVGTYGMMPARVFLDGEEIPAICGVDFCVDESMRGRGLGRRLTKAMVGTNGSRFRFITSPTATTTFLMQELGAGVVDTAAEASLFVKPRPFAGEGPNADSEPTVRKMSSFGPEWDGFAPRLAKHHRFVTVRDAAYLTWRYLGDPYVHHAVFGAFSADGTPRGLGVLTDSPTDSEGYVADLAVEPDDVEAARALLAALEAAAAARGRSVLIALERRPGLQPLFAERGFAPIAQQAPAPVLLLRDGDAAPRDWMLQPGDGDFLFRIGNAG